MTTDQKDEVTVQSLSEIMDKKTAHKKGVEILLDSDLAGLIREKERELDKAKSRIKGRDLANRTGKIQGELDELWDQAEEAAVVFTFQDIGRKPFDDLVLEHPATPEQKARVKEVTGLDQPPEYNLDTFPVALMAATAIDPPMSVKEAQDIFDNWSSGDVESLFMTALAVCKERTSIPLSRRDIAMTDDFNLNSTTALNGE